MTSTKRVCTLLAGGVLALSAAACGTKTQVQSNPQVQQTEKVAQADIKRCLPVKNGVPNVLALRSASGRLSFENCAVTPNKRVAFNRCLTNVALGGVPSKARLEAGAQKCLAQAER